MNRLPHFCRLLTRHLTVFVMSLVVVVGSACLPVQASMACCGDSTPPVTDNHPCCSIQNHSGTAFVSPAALHEFASPIGASLPPNPTIAFRQDFYELPDTPAFLAKIYIENQRERYLRLQVLLN